MNFTPLFLSFDQWIDPDVESGRKFYPGMRLLCIIGGVF
jgi:hypothetical protein